MPSHIATGGAPADDLRRLSAAVVAAFVRKSGMAAGAVPNLIPRVHAAFARLREPPSIATARGRQRPAVPIARSACPDHIVCLEDGRKLKSLKRYLRARFGMSPEEYRRKWGLPPDYPMIAPSYARREWLRTPRANGRHTDERLSQRSLPSGEGQRPA